MFNKDFITGFITGTVVGAVGYKLYEENGGQLQNLIQSAAFPSQNAPAANAQPTIEELVAQKERLEDLIAEKKVAE
jgi:hypothetical protein